MKNKNKSKVYSGWSGFFGVEQPNDTAADDPEDRNPLSEIEPPLEVRPVVSADAKYIATRIILHLWLLLFVIPLIAYLAFVVLIR